VTPRHPKLHFQQPVTLERMEDNLTRWSIPFLDSARVTEGQRAEPLPGKWALIVLNQPFSRELLDILWHACSYRVFADGGSNRIYDKVEGNWKDYLPDVIVGDFDSIRPEVHQAYLNQRVKFIQDNDLYATDLMKAIQTIHDLKEKTPKDEYSLIILGGLSGRLDHTIHTLAYLHKIRKNRKQVFVATDDNVGWVLDSGQHDITLDRTFLGKTCGLLPVGVNKTILSTKGLEWNQTDSESSFDTEISTSNWLASDHIWIKTTEPIWWTVELGLPKSKISTRLDLFGLISIFGHCMFRILGGE